MGNTIKYKKCITCESELKDYYCPKCKKYMHWEQREETERLKKRVKANFTIVGSYKGCSSTGLVFSDGQAEYKVSSSDLAKALKGKSLGELTLEEIKHGGALTWKVIDGEETKV